MDYPDSDKTTHDSVLKEFEQYVNKNPNMESSEECLFSQKEVPAIHLDLFLSFFIDQWGGNSYEKYLAELGIKPKDELAIKYIKKEQAIMSSGCDLVFTVLKKKNYTARTLQKKILQNNEALRNFYEFCMSLTSSLGMNGSLEMQALLDFSGGCLNTSSMFHFCLDLCHTIGTHLVANETDFFRQYMTQVTYYKDLGVKSNLMSTDAYACDKSTDKRETQTKQDEDLNNPWVKETLDGINRELNSWEKNLDWSDISRASSRNSSITTTKGGLNVYDYEVEPPETSETMKRQHNGLDEGSPPSNLLNDLPSGSVGLEGMNLADLHSDKLLPDPQMTQDPNQLTEEPKRFVGMISSNRFGGNTYRSLLLDDPPTNTENTTLAMGGLNLKSPPTETLDTSSHMRKVDPVKNDPMHRRSEEEERFRTSLEKGMSSSNPKLRSHVFSLGEVYNRLSEFLDDLKSREEEARVLSNPTKASDSILKDIKVEWSEIKKETEKSIQEAIRDNVDKDENISEIKAACIRMKGLCKQSINHLSEKLSMNIGLHSDAKQWESSLKSLPRGVIIQGFSNPSVFCYMVSFINLLNQNPVNKSIYMPSIYNAMNEKNSSIVASIRTNYNPQDYKQLFKIIITKFCGVATTLQTILSRMESIGQMLVPVTFQGFVDELEKSNKYQGVFNVLDSWIKILSTFQDDVGNILLQGPHSSSMIAKLKVCFVAERVSECLIELASKSPKQQFHHLVNMFTTYHNSLQEYVNQLRHVKQAPTPRMDTQNGGAQKRSNVKFREINNLSNTGGRVSGGRAQSSRMSRAFDYSSGEELNKALGVTFDLLVRGKWSDEDIPPLLRGLNTAASEQLREAGIDEKIADMIAKLILVECPICIQYSTINAREINKAKIHLVPHFILRDTDQAGYLSKRVAMCPTFVALDSLERNKIQSALGICRTCTTVSKGAHYCTKQNVCCKNEELNHLLCTCQTCIPATNKIRRKWVELQQKYISSEGQKILMNGGHQNANHVKVLTTNYADLLIPSVEELKAKLNLDISVQRRKSRFSLVFVRGQQNEDQCLILDSGASVSTITPNGIRSFYHTILKSEVTLKVATGETSVHKEAIAALALRNKKKHLAISFLIVEHQFDAVARTDVTEVSDRLYAKYAQDCKSRNVEAKYSRKDFPDILPSCVPCGLLGIRDFQLNVIVAEDGVVALANLFDSPVKIILAGPLPTGRARGSSRIRDVNLVTKQGANPQASIEQHADSSTRTQGLKEKIGAWLERRRLQRNNPYLRPLSPRAIATVTPTPRSSADLELRSMKALEEVMKAFGNHLMRYMTTRQMCGLFMHLGPIIMKHARDYQHGELSLCRCEDTHCVHCILQAILLSNDTETNPGPKMTYLDEEWDEPLGFRGVMMGSSSEGLMCLIHSISTFLPYGSQMNPTKTANELKRVMGQYIMEDFHRILGKSQELDDYIEGNLVRITSDGLRWIRSRESYGALLEESFLMERSEVMALSEILQIQINIWYSPTTMECVGDSTNPRINLFLDANRRHYSPIVRLNGKIHEAELRKLKERFSKPHLSIEEFPPLPSRGASSTPLRSFHVDAITHPEEKAEKDVHPGNNRDSKGIITISPSTSDSESGKVDDGKAWIQVKKRDKRRSSRQGRVTPKSTTTGGNVTGEKNSKTNQGALGQINWGGVRRPNPFEEQSWGGKIDRMSYSGNLPRRTLLVPRSIEAVQSLDSNESRVPTSSARRNGKRSDNNLQQPTGARPFPKRTILKRKKEGLKVMHDVTNHPDSGSNTADRYNYSVRFKIMGRKSLENIGRMQEIVTLKDPNQAFNLVSKGGLFLTLFSFRVDEEEGNGLQKAKTLFDESLAEIHQFETCLDGFGYLEGLGLYVYPTETITLTEVHKKLHDVFKTAGFECTERFDPRVSLVRIKDLNTSRVTDWITELGSPSSTEFVDELEMSPTTTTKDDVRYATKYIQKLKEAEGVDYTYMTSNRPLDKPDTQVTSHEDQGDEEMCVEVGNKGSDIHLKVSHLLDPSQRLRRKTISIHAEMDQAATLTLTKIKNILKSADEELGPYIVQEGYISIILQTEPTSSSIQAKDLEALTKLGPYCFKDFAPEKNDCILYLRLVNEERMEELEKESRKLGLSLVRCCIPLVQNIKHWATPTFFGLKMKAHFLDNEDDPISICHWVIYQYNTYKDIEEYIGCIGTPTPDRIHDISINEVWHLIRGTGIPRNKNPGTSFVLTMGDYLFVYDGNSFNGYDFSEGCREPFLKRLKERLPSLKACTGCGICGEDLCEGDVAGHMITSHNLNLPKDVTENLLQDDYCTSCGKDSERLTHMIKSHSGNTTVKNCFEFLGKAIRFGRIRQDIGDLFLIPGKGTPVHHISANHNDTQIPEQRDFHYKGVAFNYPDGFLRWENKSLANAYLSLLVVFRFLGRLLRGRGKTPEYIALDIKGIDNFRLFCPALKQARTFVICNPVNAPSSRHHQEEVHIFKASNGEKLINMSEDKERASALTFSIESSKDGGISSYIKNHCRPYPHLVSLTRRIVCLAKELVDSVEGDEAAILEDLVANAAYLVGFLSFNKMTNRSITPIILGDVAQTLAYVVLQGKGGRLKEACQRIARNLREGDAFKGDKLLLSLPKTRLAYVISDFLSLDQIYVNPTFTQDMRANASISALSVFPDMETYAESASMVDTFLFVRSNLEVQNQEGKMAEKWLRQNCMDHQGLKVIKNRISGNRTLSEKLVEKIDRIGIAHNLLPLDPGSLIFKWVFNASHRNHLRILDRPSNRKERHLGVPMTLQNFARGFAVCNQNRIISNVIEKCINCRLRRLQFREGHVGDFWGKSIDYMEVGGSLYQLDIIPSVKLAPHNGIGTRTKGVINMGVVVCIDRFTRFVMLEPLRSRGVTDIISALESIFTVHGMPQAIFCDQESSILSLAKAEGWAMSASGFLFDQTSELSCLFTPATGEGHSRNGVSERMILSIKKALGGTDFASLKIDLLSFHQILNNLAGRINRLPIATKATGAPGPGLENIMTPEMLFKGLRFHPICLPRLKTGTDDHILRENLTITQNILATFVIEHFSKRRPIQGKENAGIFKEKMIVGFYMDGSSRSFKRCYDTLKIGQIEMFTDRENEEAKSAIVRFINLSGTPAIKSKVKTFATKRKLSELICLFVEEDNLEDVAVDERTMVHKLLERGVNLTEPTYSPAPNLGMGNQEEIEELAEVHELESLLAEEWNAVGEGEWEPVDEQNVDNPQLPPPDEDTRFNPDGEDDTRLHAELTEFKSGVYHIISQHDNMLTEECEDGEKWDKNRISEVLRQLTSSDFCSTSPCPNCARCFRCKNLAQLTAAEALERKLAAEEPTLMDCIKLARPADDDMDRDLSPLRVVCKIPLDPEKINLLGNNEKLVKSEFDNKFARLSEQERSDFDVAFQDMVEKKVFAKLKDTPRELQDLVNSHPNRSFVSLAPSFKESSVKTKIRVCINASKLNANKVSLNSLTYKGRNDLDLPRTFRRFRAFPYALCSDISRFYNGTELDVESIPFQLIAYRKGCKLDAEWETYVICKLTFGIASASFLSSAALTLMVRFFKTKCKCFKRDPDKGQNIGGMNIEELEKIEAGFEEFDKDFIPYTPGNPNCNSIFHLASDFLLSSFVDDMLTSLEVDVRDLLMKATNYILNFFGFKTKGSDFSHQESSPDSETLTGGLLGVAGYNYNPETDSIALKPLQMHNGFNFRGKIRQLRGTKKFFFEKLDTDEKRTFQYLKDLFTSSGTTPTLRLIVSRASSVFDVSGLVSPLKNQIIRLLSHFLIMSNQDWNFKIPEEGFDLFLRMMTQLAIASSYSFPRFPKQCIKQKIIAVTLLWLSDASPVGSEKSDFFLGYVCSDGTTGSHLIHSGSKLSPPGLTVPRCEIDGISQGSETFYKIYLEFENVITRAIVGTDSRCVLFWALDETGKKDIFVTNRCNNLVRTLSKLPPSVYPSDVPDFDPKQGWRNLLYWFSNHEDIMTTDLGTKYILYQEPGSSGLITAEKVAPDSSHFNGPLWLRQNKLRDLWDEGLCRSAAFYQRNSKEFMDLKQDADDCLETTHNENSLENREVTILDDKKGLKKMLVFLTETLASDMNDIVATPNDGKSLPELTQGSTGLDPLDTRDSHMGNGTTVPSSPPRENPVVVIPQMLISMIIFLLLLHMVSSAGHPPHKLRALDCKGDKKLFDLTNILTCREDKFSSYGEGVWTDKFFFYKPSRLPVKSTSCTVHVQITRALCNGLNNINRLIGATKSMSAFVTVTNEFKIISPDQCISAASGGRMELALGKDRFTIDHIGDKGSRSEFYLGESGVTLDEGNLRCEPVKGRVYINSTNQYELMGGNVVKASITVNVEENDNHYFMDSDVLLTAEGNKISMIDKVANHSITPYLPTITKETSTTLFYFNDDYRKHKVFIFSEPKHRALLYESTNSSLPDLMKVVLQDKAGQETVAAIQVDKMSGMSSDDDNRQGLDESPDCSDTQFSDLIVCDGLSGPETDLPVSPISFRDFLLSRDGGANSFLQKTVDSSVSGILMSLCEQNAERMRMITQDFSKLGGLIKINDEINAYGSEQLGEVGELRSCRVELVEAREFRQETTEEIICCKFLPVLHNNRTMFLKPVSRELTHTCVVERCDSKAAETRLYIDEDGQVIRQSSSGIMEVDIKNIHRLDPSFGLEVFQLKPLDLDEHRAADDLDDFTKIKLDYANEMLDGLTLEVTSMMQRATFETPWGVKLAKDILPNFVFWLITNYWGQLLLLAIVIYEGLRFCLTVLSMIFTLADIVRRRPNNKLELIFSSTTASRKENFENQKCLEDIQSKIISDLVEVQANLRFHDRKIANINERLRAPYRNYEGRRYIPLGGPIYATESLDDQLMA